VAIGVLFGMTLISFITLNNDNQTVRVQVLPANPLPKLESASPEVVKGKELF
jgi:hypothetical protein